MGRTLHISAGSPSRASFALLVVLCVHLSFMAPLAHGALFDDEEARARIDSLKRQVEISQRAADERLGKLEAAVQDRRALLELSALIDALRQDMAKLRGQVEVLVNQTETIERRQRDLYVDLDARLRRTEQAQAKQEQAQARLEQAQAQVQEKLTAPEREAAKEKETYEAGLNQFKQGNYGASIAAFQGFMSSFPASPLVPSAQYWIGNAHYALRDFKSAIAAQQKLLQTWPDNAKAPDALLNIASSQLESGDVKAARESLQQLVKRYPTSPAAEQAKQRLAKR